MQITAASTCTITLKFTVRFQSHQSFCFILQLLISVSKEAPNYKFFEKIQISRQLTITQEK